MGQLIEVDSSMVRAVKYDADKEELEVWFNTGGVYVYEEVPQEVFDELLKADSKGRFMRAAVIDCYPYYRVSRGRRR
jgi:hypothetical protein